MSAGLLVEGESGTLYYTWNPDAQTFLWLIYEGSVDDLQFSPLSYCHGPFEVPHMPAIEYYERAGCGDYGNWQESYIITRDGTVWKWEDELNVARQHPSEFLREFLLRMVAPVVVTLLISFLLWQAYYRPIIATDKQKVAK